MKKRVDCKEYMLSPVTQKLRSVVQFLQEQLSQIPEEYRDTAEAEFHRYTDGYIGVKTFYQRPETKEEKEQRELLYVLDRKRRKRELLKALRSIEEEERSPECESRS